MNKQDLIDSMAAKSGLKKKDSEAALNSLLLSIEETLKGGEKVTLVGFGTFEVKQRAQRNGRNPQTKEEIIIPATKAPIFKAGKDFKNTVNE